MISHCIDFTPATHYIILFQFSFIPSFKQPMSRAHKLKKLEYSKHRIDPQFGIGGIGLQVLIICLWTLSIYWHTASFLAWASRSLDTMLMTPGFRKHRTCNILSIFKINSITDEDWNRHTVHHLKGMILRERERIKDLRSSGFEISRARHFLLVSSMAPHPSWIWEFPYLVPPSKMMFPMKKHS